MGKGKEEQGRHFEISAVEESNANKWFESHDCSTKQHLERVNKMVASPVSILSFTFKDTSIGTLVYAQCECGDKKDVTDYGLW